MQQYYVSKFDGSVDGPLPIAVVRACIEAGLYTAECMIRCEGMEEWQPISILTKRGYDNPFSAMKYAVTHISFKGRATRKEYWMSHVGMMIIMGASMLLLVACHYMKHGVLSMVVVSLMLAVFILFLIVHIPLEARRLHDI